MVGIKGGDGSGMWKDIRKEWMALLPNAVFSIGDGRRANFWKDAVFRKEALCNVFPLLNLVAK